MKSLPLPFNLKHEIQSSPIENIYKKNSINYAKKIHQIMSILKRRFRENKPFYIM